MRDPPRLLRPPRQDGWRGHAPPLLRLERVSPLDWASWELQPVPALTVPSPQGKAPGVREAVTLVQLEHHFQCFFLETPL